MAQSARFAIALRRRSYAIYYGTVTKDESSHLTLIALCLAALHQSRVKIFDY
jgi:hypothetical protein